MTSSSVNSVQPALILHTEPAPVLHTAQLSPSVNVADRMLHSVCHISSVVNNSDDRQQFAYCCSPLSPVLGVCVVADRLLGNKIICLTSTLECIVLPLLWVAISTLARVHVIFAALQPCTIHISSARCFEQLLVDGWIIDRWLHCALCLLDNYLWCHISMSVSSVNLYCAFTSKLLMHWTH